MAMVYVSGHASLEIYNLLGQTLVNMFRGR